MRVGLEPEICETSYLFMENDFLDHTYWKYYIHALCITIVCVKKDTFRDTVKTLTALMQYNYIHNICAPSTYLHSHLQ